MAAPLTIRVRTDLLPVGAHLAHPIFDENERLLLAAGMELTEILKQRLATRNVQYVLLHRDDAQRIANQLVKEIEPPPQEPRQPPRTTRARPPQSPVRRTFTTRPEETTAKNLVEDCSRKLASLSASVSTSIKVVGPPLVDKLKRHGCDPYQEPQRQRLANYFKTGKQVLDAMIRRAMAGLPQDVHVLHSVASHLIDELLEDTDHSIAATNELLAQPAIAERGVRMAVLGMATAVEMGWDEENVHRVGLCGLVHDWGILRLAPTMQKQARPLTEGERSQFQVHPLHTLQLLESARHLSDEVRLAATHVHENLDGSGYPNGLQESEIHPYGKLLHVVDAYLTLTTEVWGRKAYLSYDVMVYLLNQVQARRIDGEVMRAFLNVIALFPIGSQVKLSDGSMARVLRRGTDSYTKPIIQRIDEKHPALVDLATSDLQIVAPVASTTGSELSIEDHLMEQVLWE